MSEESLHEQMERYQQLSEQVRETTQERDAAASAVADGLADTVAGAVQTEGANVEAVEGSRDGHEYRFRARLDRAALVAAVTEQLPDGFAVSRIDSEGTLGIEWTGTRETPRKRDHDAVLKAIVGEETVTDRDGLIESVPTRTAVIERAVTLGIDEDDAADRLARLATLDVVDIADGSVYPDENFGRF